MRRRRDEPEDDGVPLALHTFDDADWVGSTVGRRLAAWKAARDAWRHEHGWPGDTFAYLAEYSDTRRRLEGLAPWAWGRTAEEMKRLGYPSRPTTRLSLLTRVRSFQGGER